MEPTFYNAFSNHSVKVNLNGMFMIWFATPECRNVVPMLPHLLIGTTVQLRLTTEQLESVAVHWPNT